MLIGCAVSVAPISTTPAEQSQLLTGLDHAVRGSIAIELQTERDPRSLLASGDIVPPVNLAAGTEWGEPVLRVGPRIHSTRAAEAAVLVRTMGQIVATRGRAPIGRIEFEP